MNAVYTQDELMAAAEKMAAGIAKDAPIAVRNCKKAINDGLDADMDEAIVIERSCLATASRAMTRRKEWLLFWRERKVEKFLNK